MKNTKYLLATCILSVGFGAFAATENKTQNSFIQTNFVANSAKYKPETIDDKLINAWGIAIRPAGAGGHFWVTGKDISFEYVGDVSSSKDVKLRKLHTDDLKYVKLPVGGDESFATGVVFSDSKKDFIVSQKTKSGKTITEPAKFIFASDGGIISAWTELKQKDGSFQRPDDAISVIDESKSGVQFFGLATSTNYDRLYAADFGDNPSIRTYDGKFRPVSVTFDSPFDENKNGKVDAGGYAPFNIQNLVKADGSSSLFVTYAKTQACPKEEVAKKTCGEGELFVGEEDTSAPGYGRIAEFSEDGKLLAVWEDGGKLSAPWGVAFAPDNFGALSGALLVANFGDGTIAGYDAKSLKFIDYMKNEKGEPIKIDKIWG